MRIVAFVLVASFTTVCVVVDPIVFRGGRVFSAPMLGDYRALAYAMIAVELLLLGAWALGGRWAGPRTSAFLAGGLLSGTAFAVTLGLTLIVGFGWLAGGLVPLLAALPYERAFTAAAKQATATRSSHRVLGLAAFGALFPVATAGLTHFSVERALDSFHDAAFAEEGGGLEGATARLKRLSPLLDESRLLKLYWHAPDEVRLGRLAVAYERVMGESVLSAMFRRDW